MAFVNGKYACTVASPQPVLSGCLNEPKARPVWEAPWNLIPLMRTGFETNFKLKVQRRLRASLTLPEGHSYRASEEKHSHPALQGRVQSAARGTASTRAVTGKPEPRLNRNKVTAPAPLGPGAPARPDSPPKLREEADIQGGQSASTFPQPLPRLCVVADALWWAPKHSTAASLRNTPLQKGTKESKRNSSARTARRPRRPKLRM